MTIGIKQYLHNAEKNFNMFARYPVIGLLSGATRVIAGSAQTITGIAMAPIGMTGLVATHGKKWGNVANLGCEFMIHGPLNMINGISEFALGCTVFGGNLFVLSNMFKTEKDAPFFPYGALDNRIFPADKVEPSINVLEKSINVDDKLKNAEKKLKSVEKKLKKAEENLKETEEKLKKAEEKLKKIEKKSEN